MRAKTIRFLILAVFITSGFIVCLDSQAQQTESSFTPTIPKTWDEAALSDWATPVAGLNMRPTHISAKEYYSLPVENLRTYPVYFPGREPEGYWDMLQRVGPQPLIEPEKLKTEADWIVSLRQNGVGTGFIRADAILPKGHDATTSVTFHKDVEPVLQAHCQACHRPGEIGPMPLLTYQEVRPWARSIKEAVLTRKMPPWFADPGVQHYQNDPTLSSTEIEMLRVWVDSGAPEGSRNDAPPPRAFVDGWTIGQPDLIVEMPQAYQVPAKGVVEYTYVILPTHFTEDRWVTAAEIRPGNRAVMHHAALHVRPPGSKWLREYPAGVLFVPARGGSVAESSLSDEWLTNFAPGRPPYALPPGAAFLVKAGSDFVLQFHYTTNGTEATDRSKIGLIFAKAPPAKRAFIASVINRNFAIPPGDPNYSAKASRTLAVDAVVLSAGPHMHVRGKSMNISAVYPSGESESLVRVPRYDFNWQLLYEFGPPKEAPRGTRFEVTAVWDNSPNNRYNPDPKAEVRWGDQSWEEMLLGWITLQIDPNTNVNKLFQ
jgi:hypothetical protein